MPRPARVLPDRLLEAAASEFAERGFAGARVDTIARRAGVNKAMLYYHFKSKERLYRTLLQRMFSMAAERLEAIAGGDAPPEEKLDLVIAAVASLIEEHVVFPSIMLREVAEGGSRLNPETLAVMARLPRAVGAIVHEGVARGRFRPVDPVFAYFSMLPPIVFFLAGLPIRREISHLHLMDLRGPSSGQFVEQLQESVRRALARDDTPPGRPTR